MDGEGAEPTEAASVAVPLAAGPLPLRASAAPAIAPAFTFGNVSAGSDGCAPLASQMFGTLSSFTFSAQASSTPHVALFGTGADAIAPPSAAQRVIRRAKHGVTTTACPTFTKSTPSVFAIGGSGGSAEKKSKKKASAKQRRKKSHAKKKSASTTRSPSSELGVFTSGEQLGGEYEWRTTPNRFFTYRVSTSAAATPGGTSYTKVVAGAALDWKSWPESMWPTELSFCTTLPHRAFCRAVMKAEAKKAGIMLLDSALLELRALSQADSARVVSYLDRRDAAILMRLSRRTAVMVVRDWWKWEVQRGTLLKIMRVLPTSAARRSFSAWRAAMHGAHIVLRPRLFRVGMKNVAQSLGVVQRIATVLVDALNSASVEELQEARAMLGAEIARLRMHSSGYSKEGGVYTCERDTPGAQGYDDLCGEVEHGALVRAASHEICLALERLVAWIGRAWKEDHGTDRGIGFERLAAEMFGVVAHVLCMSDWRPAAVKTCFSRVSLAKHRSRLWTVGGSKREQRETLPGPGGSFGRPYVSLECYTSHRQFRSTIDEEDMKCAMADAARTIILAATRVTMRSMQVHLDARLGGQTRSLFA